MLYTTTRSDHDTFTAERALKEFCAPDGGLYVPMRQMRLETDELTSLLDQSVCGIIASLMNRFFSCKLTQLDVEFCLGKDIVQLHSMSHRIIMAEAWHNSEGEFARIQRILTERIAIDKRYTPVGEWMQVASRIALLFCAYSQMLRQGQIDDHTKPDIAVLSGTFAGPMAAWYARQMGLPIGNIICCCNENGAAWDLLQRGEMKTDLMPRKTSTPRCDVGRPDGLERLIRGTLGLSEAHRYAFTCGEGGVYDLKPDQHELLRQGMYASVTSDKRLPSVIANVYTTNGYILCPYSALVYSGLIDYRATTGNNGPALMICETSPLQCEDFVAGAMGISVSQLHQRMNIV